MEQNGPAELDLTNVFSLFWRNKILFVIAFIASLFSAAYIISITPKIYRAQTLVELNTIENSASELTGLVNLGINPSEIFLPTTNPPQDTGVIPTIMGREFLATFVEDYDIKEKLDYSFKFSPPPLLSFAGILDRLDIYKLEVPTPLQEEETLISQVRSLISIEQYKYGQFKTEAYKINVKHRNPDIAAFIANKITEHYFDLMNIRHESMFIDKIKFLSKVVAESQLNYASSQQKIEEFMIKHPSFFGANYLQSTINRTVIPAAEKRVSQLADLSSERVDLKSSISKLGILLKKDKIILKDFETISNRENLSNLFINQLENINSENTSVTFKTDKYREQTLLETKRLQSLLDKVEVMIGEREKEVTEDLVLSDKFTELKLAFLLDKNYFETSKTALKDFSSRSGEEILKKYEVYSVATPPIYPYAPNVRYILFVNIVAYILAATIFIFLRQITRPTIFDVNQLTNFYKFDHTVKLKKRMFSTLRKNPIKYLGQDNVDIGFLNSLREDGKIGCFIEVGSDSFFRSNVSSNVVLIFSEILSEANKAILCIADKFKSDENTNYSNLSLEFGEEKSDLNDKPITSKSEMIEIQSMSLFPLNSNYAKFDRVMIAAHKRLKSQIKFYLIEKCDFFILIGEVGRFKRQHLDQFVSDRKVFEKKCRGFVLVD